jgi:hypothetical protein
MSSPDEPIEEMDELDTSGVTEEYQNKNYTDMVHRETDGPDPLVQEPKD